MAEGPYRHIEIAEPQSPRGITFFGNWASAIITPVMVLSGAYWFWPRVKHQARTTIDMRRGSARFAERGLFLRTEHVVPVANLGVAETGT